jgi:outer membrane protein assembly factor BamB
VIANIGGAKAGIIAFDARSGAVDWTATQDAASYSSPAAATIGGQRYAVFLTRNGLVGVEPAQGAVRFQRPWRARANASVNAATPLVVDNMIFVSAEYGPGAAVFRLDDGTLTPLWSSDDALSNHYATSVYAGGTLYGFHGRQEYGPSLRAVDFKTGAVRWSQDKFGAGTVTLAGDQLLVMRENGELVLAPATPDAFRPTARAKVLNGTVRAYPALEAGLLYLRDDSTLICLDLRRAR